jgi:hypothetical protein
MDIKDFTRALHTLRSSYESGGDNPQGYMLKDCRNCGSCMFCNGCENCYRCTHCKSCDGCSNSTHCERCTGCHSSAYCTDSKNCVNCKYLEQCESCADCTYCFGCVGLSRKDFHILNEPYDRKTYFEIVDKLRIQLRKR